MKSSLFKMTDLFVSAKEFRSAFECDDELTPPNIERQYRLVEEEFAELAESHRKMRAAGFDRRSVANFIKESCDVIYVIAQYAAFLNVDIDSAYDRVHQNNMSKLGPDGRVVRREDGKILKPEGYEPVDLVDLIE
jgi:predicted HAD superfamily Cof-like phosphohydrolase